MAVITVKIKRVGVLTSGGDAPGMNAAIRAVVRKGIFEGLQMFGVPRGFYGLLNAEFNPLDLSSVGDIIHRGGTMLHTARCPEFLSPEGQEQAARNIRRHMIDAIVVIGGEGSLKGAKALADRGIFVVGIPGTIDNDVSLTDATIGFDTAVNTVIEAINKIRDTATAHERTFVVEVMGRECGAIALAAGVAGGAESILIPEVKVDMEEVCERLIRGYQRGKRHSIIVVAEGAGSGFKVAQEIRSRTGFDTRVIVLGHIQRGGTPTYFDRVLASQMGAKAVALLLDGRSGMMTALKGSRVTAVSLNDVLSTPKSIDLDLYELASVLSI